jgi:hypothetical protein
MEGRLRGFALARLALAAAVAAASSSIAFLLARSSAALFERGAMTGALILDGRGRSLGAGLEGTGFVFTGVPVELDVGRTPEEDAGRAGLDGVRRAAEDVERTGLGDVNEA